MELSRINSSTTKPNALKFESTQMSRQDSGFSDVLYSQRTSTSSNRRHRPSNSTSAARPSAKRATRSTPVLTRHSTYSSRSRIRTRHTTHAAQPNHEFFHFPSLPPNQTSEPIPELLADPPATCQYWTSDSTRRLEYEAIDAASRGVKGFFIKLVPDCMLPMAKRRTRFHDDSESDVGSVRRYRLELPEEKAELKRPSLLKRWTSFGRAATP
ncbi:hypothetical protein BJ878DRAFT_428063 [Calycina marina]|uniref:Uncharacterized protein n=1 Tax=Calycina marina TaxID=1763456 RepID=A0A9P8CC11_9HELO|nr:hypothetical protein BJ878DRAFT_428063 [Calycina marina]